MRQHRKRRWIAWVLAAGMIFGLLPAGRAQSVRAAGDFDADAELLARYPLEADTKDVSGNGMDAAITDGADGVDFSGDSLNLAGGDRNSVWPLRGPWPKSRKSIFLTTAFQRWISRRTPTCGKR